MARRLDLPYVLFGYSVGAILAFELTRMLEGGNTLSPRELIVAAAPAPQCPRREPSIATLSDEEFVGQLKAYGGTPAAVLENEELTALLLPMLRADFSIAETYEHEPRSPLRCPVTAYGGSTDPWVSEAEIVAWRDVTTGPFSHRIFHGGHFFMHSGLLDSVNEALGKHLDTDS
jgi:medium-chain acyl-[acyl-carrier-protein] hydrolase